MSKAWAERFYGGRAWEVTREGYLLRVGGLCERCMRRGEVVPAKVVHHKVYLTPKNIGDPYVALSWANLEALCQECHNREHHGRSGPKRYRFDKNGNLLPGG